MTRAERVAFTVVYVAAIIVVLLDTFVWVRT
jgi:hypothetical protein